MRILLLSAYDAHSHRRWRQGLVDAFPDWQWTVLTLPPRNFLWRIRGNSLSWAFSERETLEQPYDLVIATSMTDLSTATLLFATCMIVMYIGRVPVKYLAMLGIVGLFVGVVAMSIGQRGETAKSRIASFLDKSEMPFQAEQSHIAIATGGIVGKGPGQSDQRNFLPHPYSDFVYAIIIEEYGMIGGLFILALYLVLLYRGMRAAAMSERAFGGLLSAGLAFAIVIQAMVNMAVVVGLGPITGLPLPLLSMGGTSLLFTGISLGIIQSVARGETDQTFDQTAGDTRNIARAA